MGVSQGTASKFRGRGPPKKSWGGWLAHRQSSVMLPTVQASAGVGGCHEKAFHHPGGFCCEPAVHRPGIDAAGIRQDTWRLRRRKPRATRAVMPFGLLFLSRASGGLLSQRVGLRLHDLHSTTQPGRAKGGAEENGRQVPSRPLLLSGRSKRLLPERLGMCFTLLHQTTLNQPTTRASWARWTGL